METPGPLQKKKTAFNHEISRSCVCPSCVVCGPESSVVANAMSRKRPRIDDASASDALYDYAAPDAPLAAALEEARVAKAGAARMKQLATKLAGEVTALRKTRNVLALNISTLFATARAELDRRNAVIDDLRKQLARSRGEKP
jgi:hypothetical protein